MIKVSCAIFLCAFMLLRPFMMQFNGLWYPFDDRNYFAQSSALAFGQFPSYKNEDYVGDDKAPMHSIGPGLLAAPFVFVFSFLDIAQGSDISEKRTENNIPGSWSQFGFVFSSVFYFCLACALLYRALCPMVGPSVAAWSVILMVVCQGMPLFAFRRPIFSHMAEFTLQSIFVYLFLKNEMSSGRYIKKWWSYAFLGIGAALIYLIRYNNILFAISWPLLFVLRDFDWKKRNLIFSRLFYTFIPLIIFIAIFRIWPQIHNNYSPYGNPLDYLTVKASVVDILKWIVHIFIGVDWGLVFTAPLLLVGILSLIFLNEPWKKRFVIACLPLLLNFYIVIIFGGQGGWYGYRYLIASAFPLFVVPLAFLLKRLFQKKWWLWKLRFALLAILPVMSMWCFEGRTTNLSVIPQFFGRADYSHATYQLAVWQTVLSPKEYLYAFFQGGFIYFSYIFYKAWFFLKLPMKVSLNNDDIIFQIQTLALTIPFDLRTLIRVLLIYSLPFLTWWFFRKEPSLKH